MMPRGAEMPKALLLAVIAVAAFIATDHASAAEQHEPAMQVISSDANASFVTLGINKSVVIDLPMDVKDVLIGNPGIVLVVLRSKRRVYVTAAKAGQTDVYFFDPTGRQIGGLDITVAENSSVSALPTGPLQNSRVPEVSKGPAKLINVVSGVDGNGNARYSILECAPTCTLTKFPPPELPVHRSTISSKSEIKSENKNSNTNP